MARLSEDEKARRKEERRLKKWNETHRTVNGIVHKLCNRHNDWLEMNDENFYTNVKNSDGYYPYCKICAVRQIQQWRVDNRERHVEYYTARNKLLDNGVRREEKRAIAKEQRLSGKQKEWFRNNPEKRKEYYLKRKMHKKHEISEREWLSCKLYFHNCCAYCGKTEEDQRNQHNEDFHKEHVDDNGANDLSNCIPSCTNCNCQKWKFGFEEWYSEDNSNFDLKRRQHILNWLGGDFKIYLEDKFA